MEGKNVVLDCLSEILIAQWMPTAECAAAKDQIISICGLMTDCSFHKTLKTTDSKRSIMQCVFKILHIKPATSNNILGSR